MSDVQDTSDYKLSKSGRKVRAHKIVFNKGEEEQMKNPQVNEVLSKDDPASKWIKDFVHSDNPKFDGKSKKKRINMALGAYYGAQRGGVKEEIDMDVVSIAEMIDRVRETLEEEQDSKHFEIYDTKTSKALHTFKAKHMSHANIKADDWLESQGKTEKGLKVRPAKQGVAEEVDLEEEQLDELKKSTIKSYANKKQAELDDVPSYPFKKPGMSRAEHEKAAKGLMGAIARISGKKPTSEEVEQIDELKKSTLMRYATKATKSSIGLGVKASRARDEDDMETWAKNRNKAERRDRNVQRAVAKVRGEEVEQIDELSKNTLKSYKYKAGQDARAHDSASLKAFKQGDKEKDDAHFNKSVKRMAGVSKAIDKLLKKGVKEEVEQVEGDQLDEASHTGKGNNRPGWMLRADPELAKKFKEKKDIAQARQKAYGDPKAGKSVKEEVELIEAVQVSHDRYMRSHQKMASGRGNWMFTHKRSGDVNYRNDSEVHQASGSFADAKKSAKMWAQKHGHSTVYVME